MVARQAQLNVTTRHVLTEAHVAGKADGSIAVSSLLTLFRSEDEGRDSYPVSVADIEDVLVRDAGAWRSRPRTISPVFNRARSGLFANHGWNGSASGRENVCQSG